MNRLRKLMQCVKYRRAVLGRIGKYNQIRPGVMMTSAAKAGSYNYFGDRVMVGNATIGNYCSFGPDVKIAQAQHSLEYITTCQNISRKNIGFSMLKEPAKIGNDVWIGANAVVMQGVTIGNGAVIGANAVVTHDIPPYAIAVGIPARVQRYRFTEDVICQIQKTEWWTFPFEEACRKVNILYEELLSDKG